MTPARSKLFLTAHFAICFGLLLLFCATAHAAITVEAASSTKYFNALPLDLRVIYSGVADNAGGSGVKNVRLWVRRNTGAWTNTGLVKTTTSGEFSYHVTLDGKYYFALQAEDNAGNISAQPSGGTTPQAHFDVSAPQSGSVQFSGTPTTGTLHLLYRAADDEGSGSGTAQVVLYAKKDGGSWQSTGLSSFGADGSFDYVALTAGQYQFSTRSSDYAGNSSAVPSGTGSLVLDVIGAAVDQCPSDPNKTEPGLCGCGVVDSSLDTDHDGKINCLDSDDDNDGLSDSKEKQLGTNSKLADSDRDGVSDGQEVADGTNPMDRGSVQETLDATLCSEWNGYLGGMWNILELLNSSSSTLHATTKLYNISGREVSSSNCTISAGGQCDVLVHGMGGRILNSYGKVCVTHDGNPGDLDGRMVYYKQAPTGGFEFAFAMPLSNGKRGDQFVTFNTYQPSLASTDSANPVANWIQITNVGSRSVGGTLSFYAQDGSVLGTQAVSLGAGQRRDYSGHQFGASLVGMVAWRPDRDDVPCVIRNVRYYYDNPAGDNGFDTAFQLEGMVGSGELLTVPLDTRNNSAVIEILNTLSASVKATVKIYSEAGELKKTMQISLPAFGSFHLITDSILGSGVRGLATIEGSKASSVVAVAMQYGRYADGGISYVYGVPAVQAVGTVMTGSYNTFVGQDSFVVMLNPTSKSQKVNVSIDRGDGPGTPLSGKEFSIPAHGVKVLSVRDYEEADHYGVVTVQPTKSNSIVAWVLRQRGDEYVVPAPIRQ